MKVTVVPRGGAWVVEVDGCAVTTHATEAEALATSERLAGKATAVDDGAGDSKPDEV